MKRYLVGLRNAESWQGKESPATLLRSPEEAKYWLDKGKEQFPEADLAVFECEIKEIKANG